MGFNPTGNLSKHSEVSPKFLNFLFFDFATNKLIRIICIRRFGKTISVSMFAAAMIFSCPNMELSIYSTCKRISQKLLRNIVKFLELIFLELNVMPYKFLRINQEEVHVAGNEGQVCMHV